MFGEPAAKILLRGGHRQIVHIELGLHRKVCAPEPLQAAMTRGGSEFPGFVSIIRAARPVPETPALST
jgi:hypothetical protein